MEKESAMQLLMVPDIGDYEKLPVIEVLVSVGDTVTLEQPLITLESDKATIDVPSNASGKVVEMLLNAGDLVSAGSAIARIELEGDAPNEMEQPPALNNADSAAKVDASPSSAAKAEEPAGSETADQSRPELQPVKVPDLGEFESLPIVEVLIKVGDTVTVDQSLITLESDKAVIDVPSVHNGRVAEVLVNVGDKVSEGGLIALIEQDAAQKNERPSKVPSETSSVTREIAPVQTSSEATAPSIQSAAITETPQPSFARTADGTPVRAGPAVRKLARELGVDLAAVKPTGPGQRAVREDVLAYVKERLNQPARAADSGELDLVSWPNVDFSKFGPTRRRAMERIKKISGRNLHRNWVRIPHVTNQDKADITDLEAFRVALNHEAREGDAKVTLLSFLVKACVALLKEFPQFNVSLDGDEVVEKDYYHIGFAADTPKGLMVPVIRDADRMSIREIAQEMAELASAARTGKLSSEQMQGGCISISSLGGIGGSYFTPIINAPEVAILGVGRAEMQPVWDGSGFQPRLILPLSLSWDHRAVDGAEAGRFLAQLSRFLTDFRRVVV